MAVAKVSALPLVITEAPVQAPRCIMQSVSTGILESGGGRLRRRMRFCL
jgi:hypothetical protein